MNERWIAFDISTTSTGYAIYEENENRIRLKDSGYLDGVGRYAKDRFPKLVQKMVELMKREKPDTVVVEAAFYRANFKSIEYLLKLQGCVEAFCYSNGIFFKSIETTTWRAVLGFPSNLGKKKAQKEKTDYKALSKIFASRICQKCMQSDDEADAVCIGLAYKIKKERKKGVKKAA